MTDEKELSDMSDKWLDALIEQKELELRKLTAEHDRRHRPDPRNLHVVEVGPGAPGGKADVAFTLGQLEDAVHRFGDEYGFDAYVAFQPGFVRFMEASRERT